MLNFRMLIVFTTALLHAAHAQEPGSKLIAFYNVENLFDTQTGANETAYDKPGWSMDRYQTKINNLAWTIREMGGRFGKPGPDLLGLAEVENARVVRDLINNSHLLPADYEIVHRDSPDHRGIDVAFIYRRSAFIPHHSQTHALRIYTKHGYRIKTRDLLVVSGYLEDKLIHILINHWPSRRGGKQGSSRYREEAARLNRKIIDSLKTRYSAPYIIIMGDFNDDPADPSIYHTLYGREQTDSIRKNLYNPMLSLYRKGYGSLAYRDRWHLFDQILLSERLINNPGSTYVFREAGIFMPSWLKTSKGAYKGYPLRTYIGNTYTGGFSDHFPVYVVFYKEDQPD